MEILDEGERAHGGVHLADATLGQHHLVAPYAADVEIAVVDGHARLVLDIVQEQCQLLAHGYDYSYFHVCKYSVCKNTKKIALIGKPGDFCYFRDVGG